VTETTTPALADPDGKPLASVAPVINLFGRPDPQEPDKQ